MTNSLHDTVFDNIDASWQTGLAYLTMGLSPASIETAFHSWWMQLMQAPGKMMGIAGYPFSNRSMNTKSLSHALALHEQDPRFKSPNWRFWPWQFYKHLFLLMEGWMQEATTNIPGLDNHSERVVSFVSRQAMDMMCPANFPVTNPDLALKTLTSGGQNLLDGAQNAVEDIQNYLLNQPATTAEFQVGKNLALTPGEVIYRNHLMELIQYAPQTTSVHAEPVLIIPAWIMKYYILDLSLHNSLVNWLVKQGHTVFMISWKNPTRDDSHLSFEDYYRLGAMAAIDKVSSLLPNRKIHLTGYCLGGTLAMMTASAMASAQDHRLKTLTLLAAQGDFTDAGELMTFISKSSVSFLKNMMRSQGYLDTKQMAGAFQMLRSYDLIWSKIISDYWEGKRRDMIDLTAWNADTTRMPYKMQSEYLEKLFLNNEFSKGQFMLDGRVIAPENIKIPTFAVSTEKDHIAPWKSVYKAHLMIHNDLTFVLTSGGHNAGIVSEPGHQGRTYKIATRKANSPYIAPEEWQEQTVSKSGSWWPSWNQWLNNHGTKKKISPPHPKKSLGKAPGTYVLQK